MTVSDSLVPVRQADGSFRLRAFAGIQALAEARSKIVELVAEVLEEAPPEPGEREEGHGVSGAVVAFDEEGAEAEGVHAGAEEAREEMYRILDIYTDFAVNEAALPVIKGTKSETERFAGAQITTSIEGMMQDKRALQSGTSHYFGQNFARAFEIQFVDQNNTLQFCETTSWGLSTRIIGAIIMTHGDDQGLIMPEANIRGASQPTGDPGNPGMADVLLEERITFPEVHHLKKDLPVTLIRTGAEIKVLPAHVFDGPCDPLAQGFDLSRRQDSFQHDKAVFLIETNLVFRKRVRVH